MKNLSNKEKLICTIISHTPYSKSKNGDLMGLGPTVEEIDRLSKLFSQIYHFAPVDKSTPPLSFIKHSKSNIKVIPMIPTGGNSFFCKLKHIFLFPIHIFSMRPFLKKTDILHFRAPTGFGVLFLPWAYFFWRKKIWIKYAGSWISNSVPITYKFQRWILLHFSNNAKITINNPVSKLGNNFFNFFNPCFDEKIININTELVNKKDFTKGLDIVFVGRVEENKGVNDLFKIFRKLGGMKNIKSIKIVGESNRLKYYKEQARLSSPKISILGSLKRKDVFKIYSKSHILILLSKSEGFPKVIMEAGAFGCVPIVSNFHGVSEIINHGLEGFIMHQYKNHYNYHDFQLIFENSNSLKACSMNIFKKSHRFTYEQYLQNIKNAILY